MFIFLNFLAFLAAAESLPCTETTTLPTPNSFEFSDSPLCYKEETAKVIYFSTTEGYTVKIYTPNEPQEEPTDYTVKEPGSTTVYGVSLAANDVLVLTKEDSASSPLNIDFVLIDVDVSTLISLVDSDGVYSFSKETSSSQNTIAIINNDEYSLYLGPGDQVTDPQTQGENYKLITITAGSASFIIGSDETSLTPEYITINNDGFMTKTQSSEENKITIAKKNFQSCLTISTDPNPSGAEINENLGELGSSVEITADSNSICYKITSPTTAFFRSEPNGLTVKSFVTEQSLSITDIIDSDDTDIIGFTVQEAGYIVFQAAQATTIGLSILSDTSSGSPIYYSSQPGSYLYQSGIVYLYGKEIDVTIKSQNEFTVEDLENSIDSETVTNEDGLYSYSFSSSSESKYYIKLTLNGDTAIDLTECTSDLQIFGSLPTLDSTSSIAASSIQTPNLDELI